MVTSTALLLALYVLAVARVTRLLTVDTITQPARDWLIARHPEPAAGRADHPLVTLVHCRWCMSVWVAAAGAPILYAWHDSWAVQVPLLLLAGAHAAVLLARLED